MFFECYFSSTEINVIERQPFHLSLSSKNSELTNFIQISKLIIMTKHFEDKIKPNPLGAHRRDNNKV